MRKRERRELVPKRCCLPCKRPYVSELGAMDWLAATAVIGRKKLIKLMQLSQQPTTRLVNLDRH